MKKNGPVTLELGTAEAKALYEAAAENPPPSPTYAIYRTAMRKLSQARFPHQRPAR